MVVHEKELLVSCWGNSDGEYFLVSFYFIINTWIQQQVHSRPGIRVLSETVHNFMVHH
jgi:hypothetical protein